MRLFLVLVFLFVPLASVAQQPKQVEITNLPEVQAVEVVNTLPASGSCSRFQLVGYTSTAYNGAMGGFLGVAQKCQLDFPDSRVCRHSEFRGTTTLPTQPPVDAWMDDGNDCREWTSATYENGGRVLTLIGERTYEECDTEHPIACCAPVP